MGAMKIENGPRYKRTGSPLQKKQRQVAKVATLIFAELLPYATSRAEHREPKLVSSQTIENDWERRGLGYPNYPESRHKA